MISYLTKSVPNEDAAAFIRSKPVVSRQVYDRMLPEVQALAFTVSGVERFDLLQRVRDLTAELPQGGDWRRLKRSIAGELSPFLGSDQAAAARAELILRHHGLQSYRVGQWQQVQRNRDVYPYLEYIATRDTKTRASHQALHGVILPVDDPFWLGHTGPWEWGCRCGILQKTQAQVDAQKKAEQQLPPDARKVLGPTARNRLNREGRFIHARRDARGRLQPQENYDVRTPQQKGRRGPGTVEDLRIPLEVLRDRYDADIWRDFESWTRQTRVPLMDRTLWEWLSGAAIDTAAPATHTAEQLVSAIAGLHSREEAHALIELAPERRGQLSHGARKDAGEINQGFDFVNRVTSGTVARGHVGVRRSALRAHADAAGTYINGKHMRAKTVVHELGHILEIRNPDIIRAEAAYRAGRTVGESPRWMGPGYARHEVTLEDEWAKRGGSRYCGKVYRHPATGRDYATEILSMGLERLYADPIGFAKQDPEYLQFVLEMIRP